MLQTFVVSGFWLFLKMRLLLFFIGPLFFLLSACSPEADECASLNHDSLLIKPGHLGSVMATYPNLPNQTFVNGQSLILTTQLKLGGNISSSKNFIISNYQWYLNDTLVNSINGYFYFPAGKHKLKLNTNCARKSSGTGKKLTCACLPEEGSAAIDIEIVDTVKLVIKKIIFKKSYGCNYDFPANGCPDLFLFISNFKKKSQEKYNDYEFASSGAVTFTFNDTVLITKDYFTMKLIAYDYDAKVLGEDDLVQEFVISASDVTNWTTGLHNFNGWLEIEVERL